MSAGEEVSASYSTPSWCFIPAAALSVAFQLLCWLGNLVAVATSLTSPVLPGRQKESAPPSPPSHRLLRDPHGMTGACSTGVQEVLELRSFITNFHFYQAGILHREWKNNSQVPGIPQAPAAGKMITHFHCTHFQFSSVQLLSCVRLFAFWIISIQLSKHLLSNSFLPGLNSCDPYLQGVSDTVGNGRWTLKGTGPQTLETRCV